MPLVHDQLLDLLISSPALYQWATDAPLSALRYSDIFPSHCPWHMVVLGMFHIYQNINILPQYLSGKWMLWFLYSSWVALRPNATNSLEISHTGTTCRKAHVSDQWSVLGHHAALYGYTGPGTTWANEMNFSMNHAPGAGSIAGFVDLQSSTLSLSFGCPFLSAQCMNVVLGHDSAL